MTAEDTNKAETTNTAKAETFKAPPEALAEISKPKEGTEAEAGVKISFRLAEAQREFEQRQEKLQAQMAAWEQEKAQLLEKAKKADVKLRDLYDDVYKQGFTQEEMLELATHLALAAAPDNMTPEARAEDNARKLRVEKERMQREYEQKLEELQKSREASEEQKRIQALFEEHERVASKVVEEKFKGAKWLSYLYGEKPETLSKIIVGYARQEAENGKAAEPAELLNSFLEEFEPQFAKAAEEYINSRSKVASLSPPTSRPSATEPRANDRQTRVVEAMRKAGLL